MISSREAIQATIDASRQRAADQRTADAAAAQRRIEAAVRGGR